MKPLVSIRIMIGIPAYNEAKNIGFLLRDILKDRRDTFRIESIFVVSDGSSDETVQVARTYQNDGVVISDDGKRKGKAARLNEIFDAALKTRADAVLLLDGDISFRGESVIEPLVRAIRNGVDLASPALVALPARTSFGRSIKASHDMKHGLFSEWNAGKNIYSCHGAARLFSRKLFSALRFTESVGEDAYAFLFSQSRGFRYEYVSDSAIAIRVPETFEDHKKQSRRFAASRSLFFRDFGRERVQAAYGYPFGLFLKHFFRSCAMHPILISRYLLVAAAIGFSGRSHSGQIWNASSTSKALR